MRRGPTGGGGCGRRDKLHYIYATNLLNAGADLVDIKALLGHESISTTQIYTNVGQERMEQVARAGNRTATTAKTRAKPSRDNNNGDRVFGKTEPSAPMERVPEAASGWKQTSLRDRGGFQSYRV